MSMESGVGYPLEPGQTKRAKDRQSKNGFKLAVIYIYRVYNAPTLLEKNTHTHNMIWLKSLEQT